MLWKYESREEKGLRRLRGVIGMMGEKEGGGVFHVCMMISKRGRRKLKAGGGANDSNRFYLSTCTTCQAFSLMGEIFDLFTNEINHQMPMPLAVCQCEL